MFKDLNTVVMMLNHVATHNHRPFILLRILWIPPNQMGLWTFVQTHSTVPSHRAMVVDTVQHP